MSQKPKSIVSPLAALPVAVETHHPRTPSRVVRAAKTVSGFASIPMR
jgi:hypothetical protein